MTVLTGTLNAAIDKRYDVAGITIGAVQRVATMTASAGGKGLNVSRGAQLCGQHIVACCTSDRCQLPTVTPSL